MKIVSAFISILLLALLAACGDNGTNSSRAILTGRAHVLGESTAVPGATVSAQGRSTQTDNDGNFRLDDLTPGSTTVTIVTGAVPNWYVVTAASGKPSLVLRVTAH